MARKSKKQDEAVGMLLLIVLLVIAILFLAVVMTPIVLVVGFLIYFFKYLSYRKKINGTMSDFWLNEKEKEEFKFLYESIESANQIINESNSIADSQGISRNMDGSISARSKKGKELKYTIEENETLIYNLSGQYYALKYLPYKNWEKFSQAFTRRNSFVIGLIVYILTALTMISVSYESFILGLDSFINFPATMFSGGLSESGDGKVMLIVILLTVISYFIGTLIFKGISKRKSPVPAEVDSENVDKY
jgi:hypothetical protein